MKIWQSLDLSYQYSLFGGCVSDQGICPYFYWSELKPKIASYALSLARSFVQFRAKQLFYFPAHEADELLFKEGILGHPRLKNYRSIPFAFR